MTKKVFVVGSTGRVATELIKDLVKADIDVKAGARHPERVVKNEHVEAVKIELHDSVENIAKLMQGMDAVYFVAGSRGRDLLQTDAMGAVKVMQAAEKDGIKRFIMLSSLYALEPEKWEEVLSIIPSSETRDEFTNYNIAKFFADTYLVSNTNLDYTILQPSNLSEEAGTGRISINDQRKSSSNPIADVAQTLADILNYDNTIHQVILMSSGDEPIDEALASI